MTKKIEKLLEKYGINENSTDDAKKALDAIIGALKKAENPSDETKDMLKMAEGIADYFAKEKSFSPKQAEWIANTSKALFK